MTLPQPDIPAPGIPRSSATPTAGARIARGCLLLVLLLALLSLPVFYVERPLGRTIAAHSTELASTKRWGVRGAYSSDVPYWWTAPDRLLHLPYPPDLTAPYPTDVLLELPLKQGTTTREPLKLGRGSDYGPWPIVVSPSSRSLLCRYFNKPAKDGSAATDSVTTYSVATGAVHRWSSLDLYVQGWSADEKYWIGVSLIGDVSKVVWHPVTGRGVESSVTLPPHALADPKSVVGDGPGRAMIVDYDSSTDRLSCVYVAAGRGIVKTSSIKLPNQSTVVSAEPSPDHSHILWSAYITYPDLWLLMTARARTIAAIWDVQSSRRTFLGSSERGASDAYFGDSYTPGLSLRWLPDGKHISFIVDEKLYSRPV